MPESAAVRHREPILFVAGIRLTIAWTPTGTMETIEWAPFAKATVRDERPFVPHKNRVKVKARAVSDGSTEAELHCVRRAGFWQPAAGP